MAGAGLFRSLLILLALAPAVANAQAVTRERALQAPVSELANDALKWLAPRLTQVSRPDFYGLMGPDAPLTLQFATDARSSGNPGVCVATVVSLAQIDTTYSPITTREVYKVVAPTEPLPDMWNDQYEEFLVALCREAGPVIADHTSDFATPTFFRIVGSDANVAWFGALALERIIAKASEGDLDVVCVDEDAHFDVDEDVDPELEGKSACDNPPVRTVASLDLRRLLTLEVQACDSAPDEMCVEANFLRDGSEGFESLWTVKTKARLSTARDHGREMTPFGPVEITSGFAIYD